MTNKPTVITRQQQEFAKLLCQGELSITEAFCKAYGKTQNNYGSKQNLYNRAYAASKSKGVLYQIKILQEASAVEEARGLVWDKRRATKRLLEMCHEIEVNIKITRDLRDQLINDPDIHAAGKLNQMLKVAQICNDTSRAIKECIQEMNQMYGLTKPDISLTNAVQVIIGPVDTLPEDTVD